MSISSISLLGLANSAAKPLAYLAMLGAKGQEISEWKYEVIPLPKIWTRKFEKLSPNLYQLLTWVMYK